MRLLVLGALTLALTGCDPGGLYARSNQPEQPAAPPPVQTYLMPDLVGSTLQFAQDRMQEVVGDPLFATGSTDASGKDRQQIWDRDWKVCTQSVPAGNSIDRGTVVNFAVVKLAETCP